MNKQNIVTKIAFLLDRSSSMSPLQASVIEGFNEFIQGQKLQDDPCRVSLYQFDHEFTPIFVDRALNEVPNLTTSTYVPRGNTALYDALVRSINDFARQCCPMDQVLFIINTDGAENASKESSSQSVKALIEAKQAEGWNFTFIGANLDAIAAARTIGIGASSALQFNSNVGSNKAVYGLMTNKVSSYRSMKSTGAEGQAAIDYLSEERTSVNI